MTVSDQDEIVKAVATANFCTKIDLQGASQRIRIKDEDVKKTAFSTPNGILYLLVAQQGDRNSTATLHRLVSFAFVRLYNRKIKHYADDLWPISNTKKIRLGESSMQPEKAAGIRATPAPKNKKDLQRFLGAVGYNHRSTPHLAELAAPLDALTGVNSPWRWSRACSDAFETIKAAFDDSAKLTCICSDELAPDGTFPVPLDPPPAEGEKVLENESKGKYLSSKSTPQLQEQGERHARYFIASTLRCQQKTFPLRKTADPANSTYKLALPERYTSRGIRSTFHASQLNVFKFSDESRFPNRLVDSVPVYLIDSPMVIAYVPNHCMDSSRTKQASSKEHSSAPTPLKDNCWGFGLGVPMNE
ncbi:BQ5605_C003g02572 [Microbotryum silenes-dioicae]|uniref:BQ5605_C003g02572 protein n=1 Tax=Microbotryum silenes-dioicae TaxID=796604 RepID=A0A2X0M6C5_9BASI|nr:BQ5605_C003g02572 [Microbotryum silenes-dioicae]